MEGRFQVNKDKPTGDRVEPPQVMRLDPETDSSFAAHYARAYAWHRSAYPDKAMKEVDALIATDPHDPYFLELKGQILLESGKPRQALPPLREAVQRSGNKLMITAMLGQDRKSVV